MKKISVILICFFLFSFSACEQTLIEEKDLIQKAREVCSLVNADTVEIQIAGSHQLNNDVLIWSILGNDFQGYSYLALEFSRVGSNMFKYIAKYKHIERISGLNSLLWKDHYSFMIFNRRCTKLLITENDGHQICIQIAVYPFVYLYTQNDKRLYEYVFLDFEGKVIY